MKHPDRSEKHPMADHAFRLIVEGMPGIHRVSVLDFAVLMGAGMGTGNRIKSWLKMAEDLLCDLVESDERFEEVWLHGERLFGAVWPDEHLPKNPPSQPTGYMGRARMPYRVILVDAAGQPLPNGRA